MLNRGIGSRLDLTPCTARTDATNAAICEPFDRVCRIRAPPFVIEVRAVSQAENDLRSATRSGLHGPLVIRYADHPVHFSTLRRLFSERRLINDESLAGAGDRLPRAVHGRVGQHDRQRCAALRAARTRLLAREPAVGCQRLHADLRRVPAARRPRRRPARAQTPVRGGRNPVLSRIAAQRSRPEFDDADLRPWPAGARRRARLPRGALDHHDHLPGHRRAHARSGRLVRDRCRRCRIRAAARRDPHRPHLLALELLRERARRHRHGDAGAAVRARVARRSRSPAL